MSGPDTPRTAEGIADEEWQAECFANDLFLAGAPLPWRLCEEEPGCILAADSGDAVQVDVNRGRSDGDVSAIAALIVRAVNTAGGFPGDAS